MPGDRSNRTDYLADDYCGDERLIWVPLRALAEQDKLAEAVIRLADSFGSRLPAEDRLAPLAHDIARALTEGWWCPGPRMTSCRSTGGAQRSIGRTRHHEQRPCPGARGARVSALAVRARGHGS